MATISFFSSWRLIKEWQTHICMDIIIDILEMHNQKKKHLSAKNVELAAGL